MRGITFRSTFDSTIQKNTIINCSVTGIEITEGSAGNYIYHNNFINNTYQANDTVTNTWDDDYPSGGNFWDDYEGIDNDGDGIGDTPYDIAHGENQDRYPLMTPWDATSVYSIVNIGVLGDDTNASYAYGLNEAGQVVGSSGEEYDLQYGFLWQDGMLTNIGTLGGLWSQARAINAESAIVGSSHTPYWHVHAFCDHDAFLDPEDDLGTFPGGNVSYGFDINDQGFVVGYSYLEGHQWDPPHAFIWDETNGMIDLGVLPGCNSSVARAINEIGTVVGYSQITDENGTHSEAFIWNEQQGIQPLSLPAEAVHSYAYDINDNDQVVGYYIDDQGGQHAYIWEDDTTIDLGTLGGPKMTAWALNNQGHVVAVSYTHLTLPTN